MNIRNPAALRALMDGDMENVRVASTPGGIEAQEAAGQAIFVAGEMLPKDIQGATRAQLEAIGFKFGSDVDSIFVAAKLPQGWTKRATGHSMWSDILDDKGRKRAAIFYKAAFYDRNATMSMCRRYSVNAYADGADSAHFRTIVTDCENEIHCVGERSGSDYATSYAHSDEANRYLVERYPQCRDALAYWD